MPTYLSTHIIACMTRQALQDLMATLQAAQEVSLLWASASQMAGRLVCEFEAPDQDTLLAFLEKHNVGYEWIIRVELTWGRGGTKNPLPPEANKPATPDTTPTAPEVTPEIAPQAPSAQPRQGERPLGAAGQAKILHILRTLKDESAWQLILIQHETQPVAVVLIHDAVLAPPPLDVPMFACEADVLARGVAPPLPLLTYDQIVELVFACERVMVW